MSICLFHGDLDGHTSGAIINRRFPIDKFIVADYDISLPFNRIGKNEDIYIVDFSLKDIDQMEQLLSITKNIVWIDHHTTAIQKFSDYENLKGLRSDSKPAACSLCWQYCYPHQDIPRFVKLVSDFDTWTYEFEDTTRDFVAGIDAMEDTDPRNDAFWFRVWRGEDSIVSNLLEIGSKIRKVSTKKRKGYINKNGFIIDFEGYKTAVCNKKDCGSLIFNDFDKIKECDLMMVFEYSGSLNVWQLSIYSTNKDIHCGNIAKKYGGGGHPGAAGFSAKELPFKIG